VEKKYNRISDINEKIKNAKLTYLQWKVLFLILEETSADELTKILNADKKEIAQSLEILENEQLIETKATEHEVSTEELEEEETQLLKEVPAVEEELVTESEQQSIVDEITEEPDEEETIEFEQDLMEFEEIVKDKKEEVEDETEVESLADQSEEEDTLEIVSETDDFSDLVELTEDSHSQSEDVTANLIESEQELEEEIEKKEEGDDETDSSDITSFIEELGIGDHEEKSIETEIDIQEKETSSVKHEIKVKEDTDSKKIMVVDDSIVIRKMVEIALEDDDYNIISTNNGKEGLRLLDEENPNLVILDITLPDMNGIDLLKTIKVSKGIPVIMLSGKDAPQLIENAKNAGADDFLPKPFRDEDLVEKVKNLIK